MLLLGIPAAAIAAEIPIADFARDEDISNVSISPDGKYLSEVRDFDGAEYLAVVRLSDHQVTNALQLGKNRRVGRYWWASPERLVVSFAEQYGALSQPQLTGELIGFDADKATGREGTYLYGYRGVQPFVGASMNGADADARMATVIRTLPGNSPEIIIGVNDYPATDAPRLPEIDRVNVFTGDRKIVAKGPVKAYTDFMADSRGTPHFALTTDDHLNPLLYTWDEQKKEWKVLESGDLKGPKLLPLDMAGDDSRVFLLSTEGANGFCIMDENVSSGDRKQLNCNQDAEPSRLILSFDQKDAIAEMVPGAPPWQRLLASDHPDRAKLRALQAAFPGQIITPVAVTENGGKALVFIRSDRNPGDYYLFDTKTMKAEYLTSRHRWIDPEEMSEQRPIEFKARDGQLLHGLLTIPKGLAAKNLPLVVNPHGGPFGIYDTWEWEADAQLLASRGYAVLKVNFRGSGGYGGNFIDAGKQRWNTAMIDDITDGARWAVQQGFADPHRLCIYGASYGGYAAMMSAVREPDLYRCVVAYAGIYDLGLWKKDSDVGDSAKGLIFVKEFVGATSEQLKAASPLTYIDRLKAPVMIVHGEEDARVPYDQAKALRSALEKRNMPYEWLVKEHEGHGFYLSKNRGEFYAKMLAFLDGNIGAKSTAGARAGTRSADAAPQPLAASP